MLKDIFKKLFEQNYENVKGIENVLTVDDDQGIVVSEKEFLEFDGEESQDIHGILITIKYQDELGGITERPIRCSRFVNYTYSECLLSYCLLRQAPRAFRTDRIIEVIEHNSGEIFEEPSVYIDKLRLWAGHSKGMFKHDLPKDHKKVMARIREGVRILIYIARSDGFYHPDEEQSIAMFVDNRSFLETDPRPLEYDIDVILDWAKRLHVKYSDIEHGLESMMKNKGLMHELYRSMMSVAVADGSVVSDEVIAIQRIMASHLEV